MEAEDPDALLTRLRDSLPNLSDCGAIEDRGRAVLRYVLDPIPNGSAMPICLDSNTCPNCGKPVTSTRTPYCNERCREEAGFLRQFRSGLKEGWLIVAEKQVALGQVLWHILGGGRPLRREIAPPRSLKVAMQREDGTCQVCGAPATTVDHVGSGCNRPTNLRAVCDDCCLDRPFGDPKIVQTTSFDRKVKELAARINAKDPLRPCDDAATWDWRAYLKLRVR